MSYLYFSHSLKVTTLRPYLLSLAACPQTSRRRLLTSTLIPVESTTRRQPLHGGPIRISDIPSRQQLKDEAKRQFAAAGDEKAKRRSHKELLEKWELTVGIEIHAQLNTQRKLFSKAATSTSASPNDHVAHFDLAFPGSQPEFQKETLIPAVAAAEVLGCTIQRTSRFDRKHYFYQDQPAGYQITQYYEPFAKSGHVVLHDYDGIAKEDGKRIIIGIKQVQLEQDTAKTILQPPSTHLLDFNRVSRPLIEIITLPQIHHPSTAAAFVRKVQALLAWYDTLASGMEMGGLRADVNVSVRRRGGTGDDQATKEYHGVTCLGQRTEIKNLSSFKAVEDAVVAERDRQICLLESGGIVEGETRGWTLGSTETHRLRGKEGEVDYRYMPDPDLAPVIIGQDLLGCPVRRTPDQEIDDLAGKNSSHGLNLKDAKTLVDLDNGARLDWYREVVERVYGILRSGRNDDQVANLNEQETKPSVPSSKQNFKIKLARTTCNWTLHELGGLLAGSGKSWSENPVDSSSLADLIATLLQREINGRTAKHILSLLVHGNERNVAKIVDEEGLRLVPLAEDYYLALARTVLEQHPKEVSRMVVKKQPKIIQFFIGEMVRKGEEGRMEPLKCELALQSILAESK